MGASWAEDLQAYERERRGTPTPAVATCRPPPKSRSMHLNSTPERLASTATRNRALNLAKDRQMQRDGRDYSILTGADMRSGLRSNVGGSRGAPAAKAAAAAHERAFDILVRQPPAAPPAAAARRRSHACSPDS
jgi:hypothetical protein